MVSDKEPILVSTLQFMLVGFKIRQNV